MTTANGRETKFELIQVRQEANGYAVTLKQRGIDAPVFDLPKLVENTKFTDEEHALLVRAFTLIEQKSDDAYEELMVSAEQVQARILAASKAAKDAADAKAAVEKAEAERIAAEKRTEEADAQAVAAKSIVLSLEDRQRSLENEIEAAAQALEELRAKTLAARVAHEMMMMADTTPETKKEGVAAPEAETES